MMSFVVTAPHIAGPDAQWQEMHHEACLVGDCANGPLGVQLCNEFMLNAAELIICSITQTDFQHRRVRLALKVPVVGQ